MQTMPAYERQRFSSTEERLASIKQLCKGHGELSVRVDHDTNLWKAEAPVRMEDNLNVSTVGVGLTPDIAINDLWSKLTIGKVKIAYPNKQIQYYKWDGARWVDLGMTEPAL